VITSPAAAALRDVLTTLRRRAPHVRIVLYPTPVQGKDAPARITEALRIANLRALRQGETEVLLLVRGGGSIEDLWAYNDETLARAIVASRVPVISGVGHETDFTIADFVADLRAPTPTAAAELACPDAGALRLALLGLERAAGQAMQRRLQASEQGIDELQRRLRSPLQRLAEARSRLSVQSAHLVRAQAAGLARLASRIEFCLEVIRRARPDAVREHHALDASARLLMQRFAQRITRAEARLELLGTRLALLNPLGLLERGYAIVSDDGGRIVRDAASLRAHERIALRFARGSAAAEVLSIEPEKT
jgi:exodeoxyribonuclease VII large subunit